MTFHTVLGDSAEVDIPLKFGKYEYTKIIGGGSFSVVVLVTNMQNGEKFACKICSRGMLIENGIFERFEREIRVLQVLHHPGIVSLVDVVYDELFIYIIMDYCAKGELFNYILEKGKLDEDTACRMFTQMVNAMAYIHSKSVSHRDIKPENIFLDECLNAKIADFGLCHATSPTSLLSTPCGSPFYAPPEVINGVDYDGKLSDVWSIGVVLFTMVTGSLPWREANQTALFLQIANADYHIPRFLSTNLCDLLRKLMSKNPEDRPQMTEILNHPWIIETDLMQYRGLSSQRSLPAQMRTFDSFVGRHITSQLKQPSIIKPSIRMSSQSFSSHATNPSHIVPNQIIRRVAVSAAKK